jgi:hypothetical protein
MMNGKMPSSENIEVLELKPLYILYAGSAFGIYTSFEKILEEQLELKYTRGVPWTKYINVASSPIDLILQPTKHFSARCMEY